MSATVLAINTQADFDRFMKFCILLLVSYNRNDFSETKKVQAESLTRKFSSCEETKLTSLEEVLSEMIEILSYPTKEELLEAFYCWKTLVGFDIMEAQINASIFFIAKKWAILGSEEKAA